MGCIGCKPATTVVDRFCLSDWQTLTLDSTNNIDEGDPIATAPVTFSDAFFSEGGSSELVFVQFEESATTLVKPDLRVLFYRGSTPTGLSAGSVWTVPTANREATVRIANADWTKVDNSGIVEAVKNPGARLQASGSLDIHAVVLSDVTGPVTFSGKATTIRFRIGLNFVY